MKTPFRNLRAQVSLGLFAALVTLSACGTLPARAAERLMRENLHVNGYVHSDSLLELKGTTAPALSASGGIRLYFKGSDHKLYMSKNGGAYAEIVSGSGGVSGTGTIGTIPKFDGSASVTDSLLTESGSVMTVAGTLAATTLTATNALTVANGGSGLQTLTSHAVYVGNGTAAPTALSVGATNSVLQGATGGNPAFTTTPTLAGLTLASTPLAVASGGSGLATRTIHALQVGAGTSAETQIGVGATGTVLVGATAGDPSFSASPSVTSITGRIIHAADTLQTITGSGAVTITAAKSFFTVVGSAGPVTGITVGNGTTAGQEIYVEGTDDTNTVRLDVNASTNIAAANGTTTRTLGNKDMEHLIWDGAKWVELSFNNNL